MAETAKKAFARRLVDAMRAERYTSSRNAKSGVDVAPLAAAAKVTREMARRYTEGTAIPDINKMALIATWLNIRLPWLRDGEGAMREGSAAHEPGAKAYLPDNAIEVAQIWLKLSADRREAFRTMMALEAMVATHYPWLIFGRPRSESYREYERRVEKDILRIADRLQRAGT